MTSRSCFCNCTIKEGILTKDEINYAIPCENFSRKSNSTIQYFKGQKENQKELSNDCNYPNNDSDKKLSNLYGILFVGINEIDLKNCKDENTLMHKVWLSSKPPLIENKHECAVSARRIQVVREGLFPIRKCVSSVKDDRKH